MKVKKYAILIIIDIVFQIHKIACFYQQSCPLPVFLTSILIMHEQIGQQNLAFGLKFNAKGVIDCYEKDLQTLPNGQKRDIEFKMIEGDFQLFEGKWSVEQVCFFLFQLLHVTSRFAFLL